jgi:hypothetical protein
MTRLERVLLHGGTVATGVSGLAYAAFKHLMVNDDPFSAVNHPLQPWALKAHVLAAPVVLFAIGMIFKEHVLVKMRNGTGPLRSSRRSGLATLWLLAPLFLSGYLLQVIASGPPRDLTAWLHLAAGIVFLAFYAVHVVVGLRRLAAKRAGEARQGEREGGDRYVTGTARIAAALRARAR